MKKLTVFRPGLWLLLLLAGLAGCVEPYAPEVIASPPSLLVVEGFINADGPTIIRLSRTASLDAQTLPPSETKARLVVEAKEAGVVFGLTETSPGVYSAPATRFNPAYHYRLRITTAKGQEYASAFVPVKLTPPIDVLRWKPDGTALNILVNTHDDSRASEYYRWEFDETWQIGSPYNPDIEYFNRAIIPIRQPYPIHCWSISQSSQIMLSKTTALAKDAIADFRVQGLGAQDPKLNIRYSILVRQQVLTKEEYTYWEQLKKSTESIGSLFDPQPSQIAGNVRGLTNPDNIALGFVGVHSVTEKRLFINRQELPSGWRPRSGYEACLPPDTIYIVPRPPIGGPVDVPLVLAGAFGTQALLPISAVLDIDNKTLGYLAKDRDCIDCRTRGSAVRPAFW